MVRQRPAQNGYRKDALETTTASRAEDRPIWWTLAVLASPCFQHRLRELTRVLDEIAFHFRGLFQPTEIIFKLASYTIPNPGFDYAQLLNKHAQRRLYREEPGATL